MTTRSKVISFIAIILFGYGTASSSGLWAQEPAKPAIVTVAVLDFQTSGDKIAEMGPQTAILLNAQLSNNENLVLVERQELEKLLNEQELGASKNITADTAAKIGGLTGAKIIITGRVFESGSKLNLVAKIMGTETSRVFAEQTDIPVSASLGDGVHSLAEKIAATISEKNGALLAKAETKEDLIAKLQKTISGKKLPTVAISITERQFGQPVIDPAVETEFISVFRQLGFSIIDPNKSTQKPDILINGEGFSELAIRKGNLVTCKSRVEIKALKADSGDLIVADRQTDAAVDLSERIAGKTALQNAASKLIERIVPKL